jgi:enoyl-CoA hydratase
MQTYQTIATSKQDRILTIKLNRPERLNAVLADAHAELAAVFAEAQLEPGVDLIVFTGEGKAFSAGGDIEYIKRLYKNTDHTPGMLREARKILLDILDLEVPIICAMNGDAIGLGATLALFCDVIVAVDTARIGDPHVKVGLVAGDGGAVIWPLLVGPVRAKEYLMTGNLMKATEAERIGLINHAVAADEFWPTVNKITSAILSNPQRAVRWSKRSVNKHLMQATNLVLDYSLALECHSMMAEDLLEATNAFLEKRPPKYTGR